VQHQFSEVTAMKTSNVVALMVSVMLSTAEFTAIGWLFAQATGWQ
jgi:hypothetical protein